METKPTSSGVDAVEAETRLSELLHKVEHSERFTITRNGQAIADLVPSTTVSQTARERAIHNLLNRPRIEGVDGDTVLEWIREGRE